MQAPKKPLKTPAPKRPAVLFLMGTVYCRLIRAVAKSSTTPKKICKWVMEIKRSTLLPGSMPYCDSTPLEIIKQKFGISKAAFKRALGHLMKEGKVRQENGWTYLIEEKK